MGLNNSKGNMYEFVTHTWNTIKGACPHNCSYCYMKRFGTQKPVRFDEKELKTDLGNKNFIFVGSSCDMFADEIPMEWIYKTLNHCDNYNNKYLFQTKNPKKLHKYNAGIGLSIHSVICTTIETNLWLPEIMKFSPPPIDRAYWLAQLWGFEKYITIEPIMKFELDGLISMIELIKPIQVNIGADTGKNNLPEPPKGKILELIRELETFTKVEQKQNLKRLLI